MGENEFKPNPETMQAIIDSRNGDVVEVGAIENLWADLATEDV